MKIFLIAAVIVMTAGGSYGQNAGPASLTTNSCATTPDGLVSFYPGEDSPFDVAGIHSGTLVADTGYGAGMVNRAFSFDGTDDQINVDTAPAATSFTIEAWVYLAGANSGYTTIYAGDVAGFWLLNRKLNWWLTADVFLGDTEIPTEEWHHIAITHDGNSGEFVGYLDGVEDGTDTFVATVLPTPATVGGNSASEDISGMIDELSVYDRVLTEVEIQSIVAAGSAGKCLVFRGHFETDNTTRWSLSIP